MCVVCSSLIPTFNGTGTERCNLSVKRLSLPSRLRLRLEVDVAISVLPALRERRMSIENTIALTGQGNIDYSTVTAQLNGKVYIMIVFQ